LGYFGVFQKKCAIGTLGDLKGRVLSEVDEKN